MIVIDEIAYAGEPEPMLTVKAVRPLDDFRLWVRFSDDEKKVFDFIPMLEYPCYAALKDKRIFDSVYVDYGTAVWNDGAIDIAPEKLYCDGVKVKNDEQFIEDTISGLNDAAKGRTYAAEDVFRELNQ